MTVKHFTDAGFEQEVIQASFEQTVLVDFWAPWCGPCRLVGPTIEEVAKTLDGEAIVGKLNVDENPEAANRFSITSIPTVLLIRDGKVVKQMSGCLLLMSQVYEAKLPPSENTLFQQNLQTEAKFKNKD